MKFQCNSSISRHNLEDSKSISSIAVPTAASHSLACLHWGRRSVVWKNISRALHLHVELLHKTRCFVFQFIPYLKSAINLNFWMVLCFLLRYLLSWSSSIHKICVPVKYINEYCLINVMFFSISKHARFFINLWWTIKLVSRNVRGRKSPVNVKHRQFFRTKEIRRNLWITIPILQNITLQFGWPLDKEIEEK